MRHFLGRIRLLTLPTFLLAILVGLMGGALMVLVMVPRNPIIIGNVHEVDGVVVRGQWLELEFNLTRNQDCGAKVERWLWRWAEPELKQWVQLDTAGTNPPTKIGEKSRYILAVPVPSAVTPGEWFYWSRTFDYCGLRSVIFGENVRESANIPVRVIDPDAATPPQIVTTTGPVLVMPTHE